jgi:hypothetical protein
VSTKRKKHIIKEKLGIIERVKHGDSEANLFWEFSIPEGTISSWIRDKNNYDYLLTKWMIKSILTEKRQKQ